MTRRFIPYRRDLKRPSQSLRRDPSPAERKVDGGSHFSEDGVRYDAVRTLHLESEGIRVLRFSNIEVMEEFDGVCQKIGAALEQKT